MSPTNVTAGRAPFKLSLRYVLISACILCTLFLAFSASGNRMLAWQPALVALVFALKPRGAVRLLTVMTFALLLLGGAVTTYRVGMVVPDWPTTFEENMWLFPLDRMRESGMGVTLEHSHRLWATAVGLVTLCLYALCFLRGVRGPVRSLSLATLLAVLFQGALGGFRVLENSPQLAFLHGAFAQIFYGLVCALLVVTSAGWESAVRSPSASAGALRTWAVGATILVYVQIVLGAWLRHTGDMNLLAGHIVMAFVATGGLVLLLLRLGTTIKEGAEHGADRKPLRTVRLWIQIVLGVQLLLGVLATVSILLLSQGFDKSVSTGEAITATLHVAMGATLFGCGIATYLWSRRLLAPELPSSIETTQATGAQV